MDEGPTPKSGKSRLNLHGRILERKSVNSDFKKELKGELMIRSTNTQARMHGGVLLEDSIQFPSNKSKLVLRNLDSRRQVKWALDIVKWEKITIVQYVHEATYFIIITGLLKLYNIMRTGYY